MPIATNKLRELFKSANLPCVPYAIIDDEMIMEKKKPGAYYFRKNAKENYESNEQYMTLVYKNEKSEVKKFILKVETSSAGLVFDTVGRSNGFFVSPAQRITPADIKKKLNLVEPIFPEQEYSSADLLRLQTPIRKSLESLRLIFVKPNNPEKFSYRAVVNDRIEKYEVWKYFPEKNHYFLQLAQESEGKMVPSCRYGLTFNAEGEVNASVYVHNEGLGWRIGREYLEWSELTEILENLVKVAQEQTKPLLDSIKEKIESVTESVGSINCSLM